MTYTAVCGTFDVIHAGHRALFRAAAAEGLPVVVGLTTDAFANSRRPRIVRPYVERAWAVREVFRAGGTEISIVAIDSTEGFALHDIALGVLVVSAETGEVAEDLNSRRIAKGLRPFKVIVVPCLLDENGSPIHATRIRNGEIDREGKMV